MNLKPLNYPTLLMLYNIFCIHGDEVPLFWQAAYAGDG